MGDVEFERRVEEETRALEDRFRKHNGTLEDSWTAAVRPLVERLAAAEGAATTWKGRADQLIESLAAGKVRATLGAAPEESALEAAKRTAGALASVRGELARETEARQAAAERVKDLEARVIAQDAEIRAAQDETRRAWVRVTAAEDIVAAAQAALDEAGIIDVGQEPLLDRLKRMIADANAESDRTLPEPAPEPLRVSISRARTFRTCPRRGYFEYELGRRPSNAPHEQVWGAALHRGLEAWNNAHSDGGLWRVRFDKLEVEYAIGEALTPGHDAEGRPYAPPADPYAKAALRAMLRAYAAVWGEHDAAKYEVVAVELPFDLPVLTPKGRESRNGWGKSKAPRRVGRVDLVVRERGVECPGCEGTPGEARDGENRVYECAPCKGSGRVGDRALWTVEHKSTGKPPGEDVYYRGIEVDPQIATYHDALTIMGYAPAGVLYDVVRRPDYHDPKPPPAMKRCPDCKGSGYVHHAPCSIPECDHEDA